MIRSIVFLIYMDHTDKKCKTETRETNIGYYNLNEISNILMTRNKNFLQRNINIWKNT